MKKPLSEYDTPEQYASFYTLPSADIEVFEKFKELHDLMQERNIPCILLGHTSYTNEGKAIALFHVCREAGTLEAQGCFNWLMNHFDNFTRWVTKNNFGIMRLVPPASGPVSAGGRIK